MVFRLAVLIVVVISFSSLANDTALLDATNRFNQIVTNESSLSDKWSSSYFIMHKRIYGSAAYLRDFHYLDGIAHESKAALMYKVFDIKSQSWTTYLLKMALEDSTWQVISIATYDLKSFHKNKVALLE